MRRFYRPFLLIQATAVAVVVSYYASPAVRSACLAMGAFKLRGGLLFVAATGALAGGVLPEVAKWIAGVRGPPADADDEHDRGNGNGNGGGGGDGARKVAFNIAFFAFNGVVIDLLYRGEARLFGGDVSVATVAAKVAFDQFVFNPFWLPLVILLYLWQRNGFALAATLRAARSPGFYRRRVLPLLIPNWCFWIPMVTVVYALPGPLQYLLFVLALSAWSLIMVFIADGDDGDTASGGAA